MDFAYRQRRKNVSAGDSRESGATTLKLNAPAEPTPGSRLTYEERRRIAEGLTAGLPYAEIARRLGRPRSTISREVARNGGPRHYRAHHAQRATAWRARRRPKRPSRPGRTPPPAELHDFEERFVEMAVRTGLPPMPARVLVCLLTGDDGLTAAELAARLRVSPASVSKAVNWLERLGLIRRERHDRRDRYLVDDHIWYQTCQASIRSTAMWADLARQGTALLDPDTRAGARLDTMGRFFHFLHQDMLQAADHWHRVLARPG